MSFVRSNIDAFAKEVRDYTADEVAEMTTEQFDALPLSDQISIFHNHRDAYNRLTGQTAPSDPQTEQKSDKERAKTAVDEYEKMLDRIFERVDSEHT